MRTYASMRKIQAWNVLVLRNETESSASGSCSVRFVASNASSHVITKHSSFGFEAKRSWVKAFAVIAHVRKCFEHEIKHSKHQVLGASNMTEQDFATKRVSFILLLLLWKCKHNDGAGRCNNPAQAFFLILLLNYHANIGDRGITVDHKWVGFIMEITWNHVMHSTYFMKELSWHYYGMALSFVVLNMRIALFIE